MLQRSVGIDALRGALSFWVIFVHVVPWAEISQGSDAVLVPVQSFAKAASVIFQPHGETNPAVLMFIVLSGYCIQKSWMNNPDMRNFFIRRAFRIVPVFVLGIALGIFGFQFARSISPVTELLSGTKSIELICVLAKASALAALLPAFHPCTYIGNAPLLTVMVEMTLYAAFPLLLWTGRKVIVAACAGCLLVGVIIAARGSGLFDWWQNSSLYGFLPYWWIGAAFAMLKQPPSRRFLIWAVVAWAALTLFCQIDKSALFSEIRKIPFSLLTGVAIMALERTSMPKLTSLIGRAGYSIYALHAPILYTLVLLGVPWEACIAACLFVGLCSFYLIEQPLDKYGRSIVQTKLVTMRG
jgi:peptidoglycan/LPS O-acetylase OafA/YrhL